MGAAARACLLLACAALGGCAQAVRYTDELVDERYGRTWFTRAPATVGGAAGFVVGIPVDVVAVPVAWVYYGSLPPETRDPLSVFLFPSFVLWKAGTLLGAPFDLVEWGAWRAWREEPDLSHEDREAVERAWDAREFSEYPVTPIHPLPVPDGADGDARGAPPQRR